MHRARAYKRFKLGPEKQACQNPKVRLRIGLVIRLYKNKNKSNTRGKCSICSDRYKVKRGVYTSEIVRKTIK
jgi:hypothetical protein